MSNKESYIFYAKTRRAYVIKTIGELLHSMLANTTIWVPFRITSNEITIEQHDQKEEQLVEIKLYKDKFNKYEIEKDISFLVNPNHLHKILKSIKKKDAIIMFIKQSDPMKLVISIEQPEDITNKVNQTVRITYSNPGQFKPIEGYDYPINMESKDFQKMKNLHVIDKTINITSKTGYLRFFCGDLYTKEIVISENESDNNPITYNQNFNATHITGLSKCAGQSGIVQVFVNENLPLKIKMRADELGDLIVYIKSHELNELEREEKNRLNKNNQEEYDQPQENDIDDDNNYDDY